MPTERRADLFGFARVQGRAVLAGFDGGTVTSDAAALLPGSAHQAIRLGARHSDCAALAGLSEGTARPPGITFTLHQARRSALPQQEQGAGILPSFPPGRMRVFSDCYGGE